MSIFTRLFRRTPPPAELPNADRYLRVTVLGVLNNRFPPVYTYGDVGAAQWRAETMPPLPRGAITDIARLVGCSQGYVSRIAKQQGYRVGKAQ
jgi:hypothetical protein